MCAATTASNTPGGDPAKKTHAAEKETGRRHVFKTRRPDALTRTAPREDAAAHDTDAPPYYELYTGRHCARTLNSSRQYVTLYTSGCGQYTLRQYQSASPALRLPALALRVRTS